LVVIVFMDLSSVWFSGFVGGECFGYGSQGHCARRERGSTRQQD
jgi:hypothetical protein